MLIVLDTARVPSNKAQMNVRHTDWLLSVTHTTFFCCAVRTGCFNAIRVTAVRNAKRSSDGSLVAATQHKNCCWHQLNNISSCVRFRVLTAVLLNSELCRKQRCAVEVTSLDVSKQNFALPQNQTVWVEMCSLWCSVVHLFQPRPFSTKSL
jgi:hypothetical protein